LFIFCLFLCYPGVTFGLNLVLLSPRNLHLSLVMCVCASSWDGDKSNTPSGRSQLQHLRHNREGDNTINIWTSRLHPVPSLSLSFSLRSAKITVSVAGLQQQHPLYSILSVLLQTRSSDQSDTPGQSNGGMQKSARFIWNATKIDLWCKSNFSCRINLAPLNSFCVGFQFIALHISLTAVKNIDILKALQCLRDFFNFVSKWDG
jgi:hypothetical protein